MSENLESGWRFIRWLQDVDMGDTPIVGGKNAALGEMLGAFDSLGIPAPAGVVLTSSAYWRFMEANDLMRDIARRIENASRDADPGEVGSAIRSLIAGSTFPAEISREIEQACDALTDLGGAEEPAWAVRSSATSEDSARTSFAGQLDSFLNVGSVSGVFEACRSCYASLFSDRALAYAKERGYDPLGAAVAVGIQQMVRSDLACSGVLFTRDKDTGFPDAIVLTASWGLGVAVVQGMVNPDTSMVYKPFVGLGARHPILVRSLGDKRVKTVRAAGGGTENVETNARERSTFALSEREMLLLSRWALELERHFDTPLDIEWAKDGLTGELQILQARPITGGAGPAGPMRIFRFKQPPRRLLTGVSIGEGLVSGKARLITSHEDIRATRESPVVVSETANTAWLPYLQRQGTKALVTDFGGPNSHAATVSHELGIPAVLGTRSATRDLTDGQEITLLAQGGDFGHVYDGRPEYAMQSIDPSAVPSTRTPVCMTLESGLAALRWWRLPCEGIGLASLDLLLQRHVRVHPMALVRYQDMEPGFERDQVNGLTAGYTDRTDYFLDHLAPALAQMAASQHPRPVVVRLSDLDPGQYRNLLGGRRFEPQQGDLRGASRYLSPAYAKAFELELEAARTVRQDMGFNGLQILVPRCGTIDEGERVQQVMQRWFRSQAGVRPRVHLACVLPQNLDQVRRLAELFDGLYVYLDALPDGQGPARASDPASPKNEAGRLERVLERMRDACAGGNCQLTAVAGEATADGGVLETLIRMGVDAVCVAPQAVPQAKRRLADMEG